MPCVHLKWLIGSLRSPYQPPAYGRGQYGPSHPRYARALQGGMWPPATPLFRPFRDFPPLCRSESREKVEKSGTFSPPPCKPEWGLGGSAHYPHPTAQSAQPPAPQLARRSPSVVAPFRTRPRLPRSRAVLAPFRTRPNASARPNRRPPQRIRCTSSRPTHRAPRVASVASLSSSGALCFAALCHTYRYGLEIGGYRHACGAPPMVSSTQSSTPLRYYGHDDQCGLLRRIALCP